LRGNIALPVKKILANLNEQSAGMGNPVPAAGDRRGGKPTPFLAAINAARQQHTGTHPAACDMLLKADISHDAATPVVLGHAVVLSGGSLNGAFGAGFFLGLQDHGQLPVEPDVVTGVSTGSLQATFVFLARQPVAPDRQYAWVDRKVPTLADLPGAGGQPPLVAGRTNLEDLALAYSITRESEILKPTPLGGIGVLFTGALASLAPLRQRLLGMITPGTIRQVATEACRGRVLLVGVVDVDDGNDYAIDLTELALMAFDGNATDTRMALVRESYVSAMLASSSVPLGAMPVTLRYREYDNDGNVVDIESRQHMFIDGGARSGVFLPGASDDYDVTLIVNTTLATGPWKPDNPAIAKKSWLLINLIPRTVSLLENQVYQLSVGQVEYGAGKLRMAYISNSGIKDGQGQPGETPGQHRYLGKSCSDWHDQDALANPIQFYPGYMACLIDYGRSRGDQQQWNLTKAAEDRAAPR
jgi:predicted acylesterase/phospholipase RssA